MNPISAPWFGGIHHERARTAVSPGGHFHRQLRTQALGKATIDGLRTSYALQYGYEGLIRDVGPITVKDIEKLRERLTMAGIP